MPRQPEVQKLIDSMPQLKRLLGHIPVEMQDKLWTLSPTALDKLSKGDLSGALNAMRPEKPEDMTTFQAMNEKGKEMTFLCMRCEILDKRPEHIIPGCVKKRCSTCNEEVYMSPGTCYSFVMIEKAVICCTTCMEKQMGKSLILP